MRSVRPGVILMFILAACGKVAGIASAQTYQQPSAPIPQILDADALPTVSPSPDRAWLLIMERRAMPSIAELSAPYLSLAGSRINPRNNGQARTFFFKALRLRSVQGTTERRIEVSSDRIQNPVWAPDGAHVAFTVATDTAIALWVADVATGKSRQIASGLNGSAAVPCAWASHGNALICQTVVSDRGAPPQPPQVPTGPIIQESDGTVSPIWTYQDLLKSTTDEQLFDYYFTSRVAIVSLDGKVTPIGTPGIHVAALPSPDGRYLLVRTVHRPYSYVAEINGFPTRSEIWDMSGTIVKQIADTPLQEIALTGRDVVLAGPRNLAWRADAGATLVWTEALDGGNPDKPAAKRDRIHMLTAPFSSTPVTLIDLEHRAQASFDGQPGITWARSDLAFIGEGWWTMRRTRTWIINPSKPAAVPKLLVDRSSQDVYGDPGSFVMRTNDRGMRVLQTTNDGGSAYLVGRGSSPQGDRPFLDRLDLATGKTERLWRSEAPYYEEVITVLDADGQRALTRRESLKDPPNYFVRDLRTKALTQLTAFADPAPQLAGVTSQLLTYKREDGVQLSATLYLPPGYDKSKGPLPFLFWAYPIEFKDAAAAAQVRGTEYRFSRPTAGAGDHFFLLTQGYGVLDDPKMPIIGEGDKQYNDTYIQQLVASAKAAVDKVVEMGVADRNRIAVGGHSYGGFMTANLLAHSNLFRTGIARSGAHNRTLTPFGFQSEPRTLWQAKSTYIEMSPFVYADQIKAPIMLIHGMADSNPGTFPIQSERMYVAIKGNGGKVRYVQLPFEDHGYRARESVGHVLWEMVTWLDKYVKNAKAATE